MGGRGFGSRKKKSKSGKNKKSWSNAPKPQPAEGEAAGILEFSFGYDFEKHIDVVDPSSYKFPPDPNEPNTEILEKKRQRMTGNLDEYGDDVDDEEKPSCSSSGMSGGSGGGAEKPSCSSSGMSGGSGGGAEKPSSSNTAKNQFGLSEGETAELTCEYCHKPSLIWIKKLCTYEKKHYAYLLEVCRDFRCHKFTGRAKKTDVPEFISNPLKFTSDVWDDDFWKKVQEADFTDPDDEMFATFLKKEMGTEQFEEEEYKYGDGQEYADPMDDPEIKELVEAAIKDPGLGMPDCFDKPFDYEGARALQGISDDEVLLVLQESFPPGKIPNLADVLGIEEKKEK